MRRIHLMLAALVVVGAVTLGACGGSSKSSSSNSSGNSGSSGSSISGGSALGGNFCDLVKRYKNDKTLNGSPNNLAAEKKQAQAVKTAIDNLTAAAPSEIKSEMQTAQHLSNDVATAAKNATSEQDLASKAQALQSEANTATAAEKKVDTYAKQHCGTSLGSGG